MGEHLEKTAKDKMALLPHTVHFTQLNWLTCIFPLKVQGDGVEEMEGVNNLELDPLIP